jgi:phage terminase large subunit-like protein
MGRRAGKSRAVAALGAYTATCIDYRHVLAPGEWGELSIIAQNTSKAAKIFDYIKGIFSSVPYLGNLVENIKSESIRLSSHIEINVSAASFRNLRGGTLVCTIADELAFWPSDEGSRNPDSEILAAIRPSMLTTKGQLIGISSPYARRGVL